MQAIIEGVFFVVMLPMIWAIKGEFFYVKTIDLFKGGGRRVHEYQLLKFEIFKNYSLFFF